MKLILIFAIVAGSFVNHHALSQYAHAIKIFPYSSGSREDSLKILRQRLQTLMSCRRDFEKRYIYERVVICPAPNSLFNKHLFLTEQDIENPEFKTSRRELLKLFKQYRVKLKESIAEENNEYPSDRWLRNNIDRRHFLSQNALLAKERLSAYKILLAPRRDFIAIREDPRYNKHKNFTTSRMNQLVLGFPVTIDGFVNSINYKHQNFDQNPIPDFILNLIDDNLGISISMINNSEWRNAVKDTKVVTRDFKFKNSLWIDTNTLTKEIYLSPYLVRAVFNQAYYSTHLLKFLEVMIDNRHLKEYLARKSQTSILDLDSAFYGEFVNRFSNGLQFVMGHELAHIYLKQHVFDNRELACDCNSAVNIKREHEYLNLGVFTSMIMHAESGGEINFWGSNIDIEALKYRNEILKSMYMSAQIDPRCLPYLIMQEEVQR